MSLKCPIIYGYGGRKNVSFAIGGNLHKLNHSFTARTVERGKNSNTLSSSRERVVAGTHHLKSAAAIDSYLTPRKREGCSAGRDGNAIGKQKARQGELINQNTA